VSLWLPERARIWLSPFAFVAERGRGGLRVDRSQPLHSEPLAPTASLRDWSPAVAALEAHAHASGWRRLRIGVALSDHFVRYASLEWRPGLRSGQDWEAYASHELERRYGANATCVLRIAPAARGAPRLAAAVDAALLVRLNEIAQARGSRLERVEPNGCRVANSFRHRLGAQGRLAVAEPQRLTWFTALDDRWAEVQSVRQTGSDAWTSLALQPRLQPKYEAAGAKLLAWGCVDQAAAVGALGESVTFLQAPATTPAACAAVGML